MHNTVLYLIGFAGTGKYTIAKELCALTGATLVDNHLILNPVFAIFQPDGSTPIPEEVWEEARRIREAVLRTIVHHTPPGRSFIFTNELAELPEDHIIYTQIEAVAKQRDARFIPVRLTCDLPELEKRIAASGRAERHKDTNIQNARQKYTEYTVLKPQHPDGIELDVTNLSAKEAAEIILKKMK